MQFERFYSLNHTSSNMVLTCPSFRISANLPKLGETFVVVMVLVLVCTYIPIHRMKSLHKHLIYVYDGRGMQIERFYSLNHGAVTWF